MKADSTPKPSEEVESGTGLGPDLTASVETTYSEQSSSSAGSSSSSDQPIYFRYNEIYIFMLNRFEVLSGFLMFFVFKWRTLAFVFSFY